MDPRLSPMSFAMIPYRWLIHRQREQLKAVMRYWEAVFKIWGIKGP